MIKEKGILSVDNIKSSSSLQEAIEKDRDWVNQDKNARAIYGIILGNIYSEYEYNFEIFGIKKINIGLIRKASPSRLSNIFEYEVSKIALKETAFHPVVANSLFYIPRIVKDKYGVEYLINRKSKFLRIDDEDGNKHILISVRIKIKERYHTGMLFPQSPYFKSEFGNINIAKSDEIKKKAFELSISNFFKSHEVKILEGMTNGYTKKGIISINFKNSITSSTYNSYTRDIRKKLKDDNCNVKVDLDYFINYCNFYNYNQ